MSDSITVVMVHRPRVTHPTIREIFMDPANLLRAKEALVSRLAGDIYGMTPYWMALKAFKGLYYLISPGKIRRTSAGWKRWRFNIQDVGLQKGRRFRR